MALLLVVLPIGLLAHFAAIEDVKTLGALLQRLTAVQTVVTVVSLSAVEDNMDDRSGLEYDIAGR